SGTRAWYVPRSRTATAPDAIIGAVFDNAQEPVPRSGFRHPGENDAVERALMPHNPTPEERLIVALDLPDAATARDFVTRVGDAASFYKVGLELFMTGEAVGLIDWL